MISFLVRLSIILLAAMAILAANQVAYGQAGYTPPHQRPGPAAERIQYRATTLDEAGLTLIKGDIDLYAFGLRVATAIGLRGSPGIRLYEAPASTHALILNPAPAKGGSLNPLAISEVRRALQLLMDRDFLAREVFRGMAKPMYTFVTPFDFDYLIASEVIREKGLKHAPELARERINRAMTEAGAVLREGRWHYGEKPIVLKFVIRTEDERRSVGDATSSLLEKTGFSVERLYRDFGPAISLVYGSNPALLEWHLYTEGWVKTASERWDYGTANQMAAPWYGRMPGWQEKDFWQFESPRADDLGKKIYRGEFKSLEERNAFYREILETSLEDSVRLWLVAEMRAIPTSDRLAGVTEDISAGPRNLWTPRAAYIPGREVLRIGNLNVWTAASTWNTVDGFSDLYSVDIWRNLSDPAMWRHPASAQPIPLRATYEVETAGPEGKLTMPEDAFLWDATIGEFRRVGPGAKATSKVTLDFSRYFQSRWHHGEPISMADLVYSIYQGFDMAYNPKKAGVEESVVARLKPVLETIRGYRILGDKRLEVYIDYWHFDRDHIAEYAAGFPSTPWEMEAAADHVVFTQRRANYSETAAKRFGVSWLSLVLRDHVDLMRSALRELREQRFVPQPLRGSGPIHITPEEAIIRYEAALKWIEDKRLAIISNGPFQLVRFDPPAQFAELEAFRDPNYPFRPADWYYGTLSRIEFSRVDTAPIPIGTDGKITMKVEGPEPLHVRYLFLETGTEKILRKGDAEPVGAKEFHVTLPADLTATLSAGLYQLHLIAYSDKLSSPTERLVDLTIGASLLALPEVQASSTGPLSEALLVPLIAGLLILAAIVVIFIRRRRRKA